MNRKTLVIAVIVVVVVAAVVAGVYLATQSGGGGGGGGGAPDVAGATSLGFKVNATIGGVHEEYAFTAKNLGTSEVMLRVDEIDAQGNAFVYVFNQTAQTVWASVSGQWNDVSSEFASYWDGANSAIIGYTAFEGYKTQLATNWSGSGDYDYTSGGDTFHIFDIIVNPSLADSLFQHS